MVGVGVLILHGQEFVRLFGLVILDAGEHILQPSKRFHFVYFAGYQKRIDHGSVLGGIPEKSGQAMRSGKQIVLALQGYRADGVFDQVVINLETATLNIPLKAVPQL